MRQLETQKLFLKIIYFYANYAHKSLAIASCQYIKKSRKLSAQESLFTCQKLAGLNRKIY